MRGTIIAGALGNCVHVAGVISFLKAAQESGYRAEFLGPALSPDEIVEAIKRFDPEIVGISYRLTPEVGRHLLIDLYGRLRKEGLLDRRFLFGGTPPVCRIAESLNWFERCFDGHEQPDDVTLHLKGIQSGKNKASAANTLSERLRNKRPYPLLRHHFGLPSMKDTISGISRIAESGVLDVISIAPDQNAQEYFFNPEKMDVEMDGAGGTPIRTPDDLTCLYQASRYGNFPLLRIYSGTRDLLRWAKLVRDTLHNAWAAVPLCWYNILDGRSERPVIDSIYENQKCMAWHGERNIPVEVNEAHHWGLRDAHDAISVAAAYLAAYNAKMQGVRYYVAQYMLNTPPGISPAMDIAKTLAQIEMVESLHGPEFRSIRQTRAGLLHLSPRPNIAKGQLAASTMLALLLKPDIIHVVGYCEGDHAAESDDVIESCEIVHGVLRNCLSDMPDITVDPYIQARKGILIRDADLILNAVKSIAAPGEEPFTSPVNLARAIKLGILDAPHLRGNPGAAGLLNTRVLDGAVYPYDPVKGEVISEDNRISGLLSDLTSASTAA